MNLTKTIVGKAEFHSVIVTKSNGQVERYDPVRGDMSDMEACKALAESRAALIAESPHLREVFYGRTG